AAPTGIAQTHRAALYLWERPCVAKGLRSSPNDFSLNEPARRVLKRWKTITNPTKTGTTDSHSPLPRFSGALQQG
ncbi:hypothetical protein, partial [Pseudomonas sp. XP1]